MKIDVYTDGSAILAAKPGGFGWVLIVDGEKHSEGHGHIRRADSNDAELEAALQGVTEAYKIYEKGNQGLQFGSENCEVTLYSDCKHVLGWANGTYEFKLAEKYKRFKILITLIKQMNAKTRWIRGHGGHEHNERCDELASLGRLRLKLNDKLPRKKTYKSSNTKNM
jgi:ribonuclease HI